MCKLLSMGCTALVAGVILLAATGAASFGQSFRGIGGTTAASVSADGSTVVGNNGEWSKDTARPWRWTTYRGVVFLPSVDDGAFKGLASGVSADGSFVVGRTMTIGPNPRSDAVRWDAAGKPLSLGAGDAEAVSASGRDVAGSDGRAVLWSAAGGGVTTRVIVDNNIAFGLTPDGSVAVGGAIFPGVGRSAFRWTASGGVESLGYLPGHTYSDAHDVSDDGRTVVGYGEGTEGTGAGAVRRAQAFRWTAGTGMVGLGDLPGGIEYSFASSVSADGSLVAGYANSNEGIEYLLWDAAGNIRRLRDVLQDDYGLDLGGWNLTAPNENGTGLPFTSPLSLSADGRTIVGTGINPLGVREAWIAIVPEPSSMMLLALAGAAVMGRSARRR